EGGGMAEAIALQVVVPDLADALGAQRLPREVLAGAPAALTAGHARLAGGGAAPLAPRMLGERPLAQRRQLLGELPPSLHGEGGGDADVVQPAATVEEA